MFRAFWTEKYPMLKEFSDITLALLHELGHLETNDEVRKTFSYKDRYITQETIGLLFDNDTEKNFQYFSMPDEASARRIEQIDSMNQILANPQAIASKMAEAQAAAEKSIFGADSALQRAVYSLLYP